MTNADPSTSPPVSVAIVGAGMSGLMAARTLADQGLRVRVFEKSRGPGGRMATRRTGEYAFDHGAQYFTARDERFGRSVESWSEEGLVARWEGRIGVAKNGTLAPKNSQTERYVGTPRMSGLTRHLAGGLDLGYTTRVGQILRDGKRWALADAEGETLGTFDVVLVTTPPEQAVPLLAEAPALARQAAAVEMLPCWAVMAVFEQTLPVPFDGLFVHDAPVAWAARNSSKPGRPAPESWVLHAAPAWSREHLEADPQTIPGPLLTAFFEATGLDPAEPAFAQAHRWRYSMAAEPLEAGCLWDAGLRIGVCGDWCHTSRIEGAFLSGMAAAGRVLEQSALSAGTVE